MLNFARLAILAALAISVSSVADEPAPQPKRTILERHDQSGVPDKEILTGTAALPAGTGIGFHTHPGDETAYVLTGSLILKIKGQPDRPLKPGDTFFIPRGVVHSLVTAPGSDGSAVSTWIVDKGKPLATPVTD